MILATKYFSQFRDVVSEEWKPKACSLACLKMALDYHNAADKLSIDDLIKEGIAIGGYSNHGWTHHAISLLSHNHGVPAYHEEFRSVSVDPTDGRFSKSSFEDEMLAAGLSRLQKGLDENRLPIVSIMRNWDQNSTFHSILLVGYESEGETLKGFYYHDPDTLQGEREGLFVDTETFLKNWRKMAVFIG